MSYNLYTVSFIFLFQSYVLYTTVTIIELHETEPIYM